MRRIKIKEKEVEAQEGEIVETRWDIKKIAIGILALILLFIVASYIFLPSNDETQTPNISILGTADDDPPKEDVPPLPNKEDVENIISNAQSSLSKITADNLTSSQAAIQKVITDLQAISDKKDAVGAFCEVICKDK